MDNLPISEQELADVDLICRAATEVVWQEGVAGNCNVVSYNGDDVVGVAIVASDANRKFVVSARQNLPRLIAEVRRQREEIAALKADIKNRKHQEGRFVPSLGFCLPD